MPPTMPAELQPIADLFNRAVNGLIEQGTLVMVLAAVGAGLVGLSLLLWGRIVNRAVLVLIAFPMGMGIGSILAEKLGLSAWLWLTVFSSAAALTVLVIALARVVWALLAGLLLGTLVGFTVAWLMLGDLTPASQPGWNPTPMDLAQSAWAVGGLKIVAAMAGAGAGGLVLGLFLPRTTVIAVTSMLGATVLCGAVAALAGMAAPEAVARMQAYPLLTMGVFAGVLLLGIIHQSVSEVRARRAKAKSDDDDAPKDVRKPPKPSRA